MQADTLLTRNFAHGILKRTLRHSKYSTVSSLEPYLTFIVLGYKILLPMDTQSSSTRALKPAQEQEVAKIGDGPQERDRARRAAETSEQRSEKAKGERLY